MSLASLSWKKGRNDLGGPKRGRKKAKEAKTAIGFESEVFDSLRRLSQGFIRKFGLRLKEFSPFNNQTWVLVNGVRHRSGAVQANPGLLRYSVRADEVGKTAEQLFIKSLRKVRQSGGQTILLSGPSVTDTLKFLSREEHLWTPDP